MPSLLKAVLQTGALGQGLLPVLADKRRGIYQVTFQYLQERQMLSQEWHQGQVLLYLPEFQEALMAEATKQGLQDACMGILRAYQIPELQLLQHQARSINHKNPDHEYNDQD